MADSYTVTASASGAKQKLDRAGVDPRQQVTERRFDKKVLRTSWKFLIGRYGGVDMALPIPRGNSMASGGLVIDPLREILRVFL